MANLYDETIRKLEEHDKTFADVVAICGDDFQITKEDFIKFSNVEYDNGFGSPKVAQDLKIIGNDFWLERHEYDGSEWWEYKTRPNYKDKPIKEIKSLMGYGWSTLSEIQDDLEERDSL